MKTVRILQTTALCVRDLLATAIESHPQRHDPVERAFRDLDRALAPKPRKSWATGDARKKAKKATKREQRSAVRVAVFERANGRCEQCGRSLYIGDIEYGELDHFWGKARAESAESCWALCRDCHYLKTRNDPSSAAWLSRFIEHLSRHEYSAELKRARARLAFVTARSGGAT